MLCQGISIGMRIGPVISIVPRIPRELLHSASSHACPTLGEGSHIILIRAGHVSPQVAPRQVQMQCNSRSTGPGSATGSRIIPASSTHASRKLVVIKFMPDASLIRTFVPIRPAVLRCSAFGHGGTFVPVRPVSLPCGTSVPYQARCDPRTFVPTLQHSRSYICTSHGTGCALFGSPAHPFLCRTQACFPQFSSVDLISLSVPVSGCPPVCPRRFPASRCSPASLSRFPDSHITPAYPQQIPVGFKAPCLAPAEPRWQQSPLISPMVPGQAQFSSIPPTDPISGSHIPPGLNSGQQGSSCVRHQQHVFGVDGNLITRFRVRIWLVSIPGWAQQGRGECYASLVCAFAPVPGRCAPTVPPHIPCCDDPPSYLQQVPSVVLISLSGPSQMPSTCMPHTVPRLPSVLLYTPHRSQRAVVFTHIPDGS